MNLEGKIVKSESANIRIESIGSTCLNSGL